NSFALVLDILQVHGRDDSDSGCQQFLHILPPVGIAAAFGVVVSEAVNETDLRFAMEDCCNVNDEHAFDVESSNDLKRGQQWLNFGKNLGLQSTYYDVLPALFAPSALVEHAKGFTDS